MAGSPAFCCQGFRISLFRAACHMMAYKSIRGLAAEEKGVARMKHLRKKLSVIALTAALMLSLPQFSRTGTVWTAESFEAAGALGAAADVVETVSPAQENAPPQAGSSQVVSCPESAAFGEDAGFEETGSCADDSIPTQSTPEETEPVVPGQAESGASSSADVSVPVDASSSDATLSSDDVLSPDGASESLGASDAQVMALGVPSVVGTNIYGNGSPLLIRRVSVVGIPILTTVFQDNGVVGVYEVGIDLPVTLLAGLDLSGYTVFGGGTSDVTGDTRVTMLSGTVSRIFGGGDSGKVSGNSRVSILGGTVTGSVYGAGNQAAAQVAGYTEVTVNSTSENTLISGSVVGGGLNGTVGGQGAAAAGKRACNVLVSQGSYTAQIQQAVIGGGYIGSVTSGGTAVRVTGGVIGWNTTSGTIYGAGYSGTGGTVTGDVDLVMSGGQTHFLYGGAYAALVSGNVTVTMTGGSVLKDLSGGGALASATVSGNIAVSVTDSTIAGYAGAGTPESTTGSRLFSVAGNTKIGKANTSSGLLLKNITGNLVTIQGALTCQAGDIYLRRAANPVPGGAVARAASAANADATKFSLETGCALRAQGTDLVWSIANLYWNGTSGNDALDGLTPATAVRTLARAKAAVNTNGTILITGNIPIAAGMSETWDFPDMSIVFQRDASYMGELITIQKNASLTLKNVRVNGGLSMGIVANAPIVSVAAGGFLNLTQTHLLANNNPSGVGGVYAAETAQITISGTVYIASCRGVSGLPSNLYLAGASNTGANQLITITAPLIGAVGVSIPKAPTPFSGAIYVAKTSNASAFSSILASDAGYRCAPNSQNSSLLFQVPATPPVMADVLLPGGAESTLRFTVSGIDMTTFATPQYVRLLREGTDVTSSVSIRGGADGSVALTAAGGFPAGRYQVILDGNASNTFAVSTWTVTGALTARSGSGTQGSRVTLRLASGYTGETAQAFVGAGTLTLAGAPVTITSTSEVNANRTLWGSTNAMRRFAIQVGGVDLPTAATTMALTVGDNEIVLRNANALSAAQSGALTLPVSIAAGTAPPAQTTVVIPCATQQAQLSATVPLTMTLAVQNDGTVIAPDSTRYAIANESAFPISVTRLTWNVTDAALFRYPDRLALTLNGEALTNGVGQSPQHPTQWSLAAGSASAPTRLPLAIWFGLGAGNALTRGVDAPAIFCNIRYTIAVAP